MEGVGYASLLFAAIGIWAGVLLYKANEIRFVLRQHVQQGYGNLAILEQATAVKNLIFPLILIIVFSVTGLVTTILTKLN